MGAGPWAGLVRWDVGTLGFEPRSAGIHRREGGPPRDLRSTGHRSSQSSRGRPSPPLGRPVGNHSGNWSPRCCLVTPCPHGEKKDPASGTRAGLEAHFCLRASRFRRRIFFFRHFQRCLPRFFHARELLFMGSPLPKLGPRESGLCYPLINIYGKMHSEAVSRAFPDLAGPMSPWPKE